MYECATATTQRQQKVQRCLCEKNAQTDAAGSVQRKRAGDGSNGHAESPTKLLHQQSVALVSEAQRRTSW